MKFKMEVKGARSQWWEEYDVKEVKDIKSATEWAKTTITRFNEGLRPGETARELLNVELVGASTEHDWDKDLLRMSAEFRGRIVDGMICRRCGITGKRYGLQQHVKIDSKFKAKVFRTCTEEAEKAARALL